MFFIKEYLFIRLTYSKKLAIIYRIMITEVTDMPQNKGPFYMTTAIAYTSGKPHIGNTYEVVLADSIARFRRQEGYDVFFQTGTDEHGQKIELKAEEAGITPKEFVDNVSTEIKRIWDLMDTSYDKFIRTTDDYHEKQVQKIFKKLYDQGDIYKGSYEGMYCTPCESFWTESQLVDGKCPDCGREVKPAKEEAYFFKMSKYANRLIEHINTHPEFIQPVSRKNEMMNNFLLPGLQDLCVSRTSFKWGIPVDFDDKHVVYVWLDALTNYITGIGWALVDDITHAEIKEEKIINARHYHTIQEVKNGEGPHPIKTDKGWLHLAHGVRGCASGLRYVLYMYMTSLEDPTKVIAEPGGYLLVPEGPEYIGDVMNVVFANGWIADEDGKVFIYYASSDTRMHVATSTIDRLVDYCMNTPKDDYRTQFSVEKIKALVAKNKQTLSK